MSSDTSRATCAKRACSRRSASLSHSSVGSTGSISVRLRTRCANGERGRDLERNRAAIGMADEMDRPLRVVERAADRPDFFRERQRQVQRASIGAIARDIGGEKPMAAPEFIGERLPLAARAERAMQRHDAALSRVCARDLNHIGHRNAFLFWIGRQSAGQANRPRWNVWLGRATLHRLVMTTSRYSLGTTMVPSPERFMRTISACRSLCSSSCFAGSRAANAFSTGP